MSLDELAHALAELPGVHPRVDEPMSRHVPLRAGGPADLWAVADDLDGMKAALAAARKAKVRWRVHWPLGDWLVRDGGVNGLVIRPGRGFETVRRDGEALVLGSASLWSGLSQLGAEGWWRGLLDWPGSVGGLLAADGGEWLLGSCTRLRWLKGRSVHDVQVSPREGPPPIPDSAVLIEVELHPGLRPVRRNRRRRPRGPGAFFADPKVAGPDRDVGRVLHTAGVLGTRLRNWQVSATHAGALVQLGGGSCSDALLLASAVQERVQRTRGIKLERRIPLVGRDARKRRAGGGR